jgi:hypothetical protein
MRDTHQLQLRKQIPSDVAASARKEKPEGAAIADVANQWLCFCDADEWIDYRPAPSCLTRIK